MIKLFLLPLVLTSQWVCLGADVPITRTKFKAAVYGHAVILPPPVVVTREKALLYMRQNIEVYRQKASEAKLQGADILVFPEDGLYGFKFTRESIYNYLENIPTPLEPDWSPCDDPDLHPDTEVLHDLSCIAKNNSMYIVANMGDKQPCDIHIDPKCPRDGRYQFNTDIAFDPNGTIIAKYHKYHLFFEEQFDTPTPQIVTFDTPFGKFGMMVCFDVLFWEPGLPMILDHNIANIVFPTAWMDALPLLSALGFHSSFARALGVNFLSADIHIPSGKMHGSGIYSPGGMKAFYYGARDSSPPKLLVAELDVMDKPKPAIDIRRFRNPLQILKEDSQWFLNNEHEREPEFTSELFHDKFTFKLLTKSSNIIRVCQKDVCCSLQYSLVNGSIRNETYAFGAFDGLHTVEGQYYFQICALVKCADAKDRSSCGAVTDVSTTRFSELRIKGEMKTPYIYPQVLMSDGNGEILLTEPEVWSFHHSNLWTNVAPSQPLLSVALFGRFYERDNSSVGLSEMSFREIPLLALSSLTAVFGFRYP